MTMQPGLESPSVRKEDGGITVTRTIRIPSGSIVITGMLTEADRIFRLLPKYLSQNGYKMASQSPTNTVAPPGSFPSESETTFLRHRVAQLEELLGDDEKHQKIKELTRLNEALIQDRNQWMTAFKELDEIMSAVYKTLEGGDAPHTVRETIAIQQLDQA